MPRHASVLYERTVLIDTSAVIALFDDDEPMHQEAQRVFARTDLSWVSMDVTAHEVYTRVRYDRDCPCALQRYAFLRSEPIKVVRFTEEDESAAHVTLV